MSNPYEVEHNIKPSEKAARPRHPSMTSFFSSISQIEPGQVNPHATATPVDVAASVGLLQSQIGSFLQRGDRSTGDDEHDSFRASLLLGMLSELDSVIESPPTKIEGVPQSYLDELDRVPKKNLKKEDVCPICSEKFLDDPYPLVVRLPCHPKHMFDLECVGPWLCMQGTCPLDRKELMKKETPKPVEDDEEEDYDADYA